MNPNSGHIHILIRGVTKYVQNQPYRFQKFCLLLKRYKWPTSLEHDTTKTPLVLLLVSQWRHMYGETLSRRERRRLQSLLGAFFRCCVFLVKSPTRGLIARGKRFTLCDMARRRICRGNRWNKVRAAPGSAPTLGPLLETTYQIDKLKSKLNLSLIWSLSELTSNKSAICSTR